MARNNNFLTTPHRVPIEESNDLVTVVLLCENAGHRMKSYGPTPLAKIGSTTLIDLQIASIMRVIKNFELIICGGFEAEKVIKHIRDRYKKISARFVENQIYNNSNSCESLRLCLNNTINDKILVCNGEIIIQDELLKTIDTRTSSLVYEEENDCFDIGITIDNRGEPQNLCYGMPNKWCEVVFFNNALIIEFTRKLISNLEYKNKFIFEAINDILKSKHKIKAVTNQQKHILKLDNIKTYHQVRKTYARTDTRLLKP